MVAPFTDLRDGDAENECYMLWRNYLCMDLTTSRPEVIISRQKLCYLLLLPVKTHDVHKLEAYFLYKKIQFRCSFDSRYGGRLV